MKKQKIKKETTKVKAKNSKLDNKQKHKKVRRNQNSSDFFVAKNSAKNDEKIIDNSIFLYGKHVVFSLIKKAKRKIYQIYITKKSENELVDFIKKNHRNDLLEKIKIVDNNFFLSKFGNDTTHQLIAVMCSNNKIVSEIDFLSEIHQLLERSESQDEALQKVNLPKIIMLDQISDPQNIGAIIRSAVAFGVKNVIITERNSVKETAVVVKSSAATFDEIKLISVSNFNYLIEKLKKLGYWFIGLDKNTEKKISDFKDCQNLVLVIGSEGNGIRSLVKKNCDFLAKIEINEEVESLNASVAAAIALYEINKI
jgi:23S rRNA (guanosine2251-2'-O)-methyltransferase